jgi:hypothetical protein
MVARLRLASAFVYGLIAVDAVLAANQFYVEASSLSPVAGPQEIAILGDNDVTVLGYSLAVRIPTADATILGVSKVGTVGEEADFFEVDTDPATGQFAVGCVFDVGGNFSDQKLDPGTARRLAVVSVEVLVDPGSAVGVQFADVQIDAQRPPVRNVMTNESGFSIKPNGEGPLRLTLVDGSLAVSSLPPTITSIVGNRGLAGTVFTVVGENFDQAGLTVKVCGVAADATLNPAKTEISIVAPVCGTVGFAPLEVCTDQGCDTEPNGFEYEDDSTGGVFLRGDTDDASGINITDGIRVLNFLFLGGEDARCRDSMDANDSASVDIADGIFLFNFLFLGGIDPPPPFPAAGTDPTADALPECTS